MSFGASAVRTCLALAVALPLGALAQAEAVDGPAAASPSYATTPVVRAGVAAAAVRGVPPRAPRPVAVPVGVPVVQRGDGVPVLVPGGSAPAGSGPLSRYTVAVEGGLGVDPRGFARAVDTTLRDARSWGAGERRTLQRVDRGPVTFRVVLASPDTTDRLCRPLRTGGTYSCASGATAVINARRWLRGAEAYRGDLAGYRAYVVNHEVGHTLGRHHAPCPGPGRPAPVMMQQTKGVGACRPNPWPFG